MELERIIYSIDPYAKIIPGRFTRCKSNFFEIIVNSNNRVELFIKLKFNLIFQRIKVECSSVSMSSIIFRNLQGFNSRLIKSSPKKSHFHRILLIIFLNFNLN